MSETYFVRVRGRTLGPYDLEAIRQMTRKAKVGRAHEVSLDGISWTSASNYPEIFDRPQQSAYDARGSANLPVTAAPTPEPEPLGATGPGPGASINRRGLMWHYTMGGQQQDKPVDQQSLINLIASGQVGPDDSVWNETMPNWVDVGYVPELAAYALPNPSLPGGAGWGSHSPAGFAFTPSAGRSQSEGALSPQYQKFVGKKVAAGVLALVLGNLGIHKFMLGLTTGGLTMLLLFFLLIPIPVLTVISLVEGILYLSKSDEQFFRDYAMDKKQWF